MFYRQFLKKYIVFIDNIDFFSTKNEIIFNKLLGAAIKELVNIGNVIVFVENNKECSLGEDIKKEFKEKIILNLLNEDERKNFFKGIKILKNFSSKFDEKNKGDICSIKKRIITNNKLKININHIEGNNNIKDISNNKINNKDIYDLIDKIVKKTEGFLLSEMIDLINKSYQEIKLVLNEYNELDYNFSNFLKIL